MKSNIHKKLTFEDKFDRKYACWVENNRKAWRFWKKKARKDYRRMMDKEVQKAERRMTDINYSQYCAYRLPCGICTRTNSYCPLFSGIIDVTCITESTSITVNSVVEGKEE